MGKKNLDQLKSLPSIKRWDAVHNAEDAESAFIILQGVLEIACPKRKNKRKGKTSLFYDRESSELKTAFLRAMKIYELPGRAHD